MMIHLTIEQADEILYSSDPKHSLEPRALKDMTYVLPVVVLDDPAHADHHDFLSMLPRIEDPEPEDYWEPEPA